VALLLVGNDSLMALDLLGEGLPGQGRQARRAPRKTARKWMKGKRFSGRGFGL
jgi:hypothetical protein